MTTGKKPNILAPEPKARVGLEALPAAYDPPKPQLTYMGRFTVELTAPVWELGPSSDAGKRRIIPITGGRVEGPLVNGEVLNNGADWQIVTKEAVALIDTRYLLKMDDGEYVYLQTRGMRHGPADVISDLGKGLPVDPAKYYFRIYMNFETSSKKYGWLNHSMAVGYVMRLGNAVIYDAYLLN